MQSILELSSLVILRLVSWSLYDASRRYIRPVLAQAGTMLPLNIVSPNHFDQVARGEGRELCEKGGVGVVPWNDRSICHIFPFSSWWLWCILAVLDVVILVSKRLADPPAIVIKIEIPRFCSLCVLLYVVRSSHIFFFGLQILPQ